MLEGNVSTCVCLLTEKTIKVELRLYQVLRIYERKLG